MKKMHNCAEAIEGSNDFSCSVGGNTVVRTNSMNSVGLWQFMGDDMVFIADKSSSGSGSLRLSSSSPTSLATTSKATLKLPDMMPATSLTTISYDYYSNNVDDSTPL